MLIIAYPIENEDITNLEFTYSLKSGLFPQPEWATEKAEKELVLPKNSLDNKNSE